MQRIELFYILVIRIKMKVALIILCLLIIGCAASQSNHEYYSLNSGTGWTTDLKPEDVKNYVPWEKAIDILLHDAKDIEAIAQGHNLQVNIIYKNQEYFGTIEPNIDTIFMVLKKCGLKCEHIHWITE